VNGAAGFSGGTLQSWRNLYAPSLTSADPLGDVALRLSDWVDGFDVSDPTWISRANRDSIQSQVDALRPRLSAVSGDVRALPLFGIPFAVKDNIDVAGWLTTAACPAFAYRATADATVVRLLRDAGAILVGKTNMDQFATGLVGTRSPYGPVPSSLDPARVGGGSSSGSASAVARGLVPFSLGTDTAGSGRVPAAFHNIVGYKPTKGRFSTHGVVPACRTLDCVSIFALTVGDARCVAQVLDQYDPLDPYARRVPLVSTSQRQPVHRLGVPQPLEFFGDSLAEQAFEQARKCVEQLGIQLVPVDFAPFRALADLLYSESWVTERALVAGPVLEQNPDALDPVVRGILQRGSQFSAAQTFRAEYRRAELARAIDVILEDVDGLLVPTTPTSYRLSQVEAEPVATNTRLGTYTNFTNLADLCGVAVPSVFRADGFPAGITLLGRAFEEARLVELAHHFEHCVNLPLGALGRVLSSFPDSETTEPLGVPKAEDRLLLAVVGAHLRDMPLCHQLTERDAHFVAESRTAPCYRLHLVPGSKPQKPGLLRVKDGAAGASIALELWSLPKSAVGDFISLIPPPLGIGTIELDDGRWVKGFICEPCGLIGAEDITEHGGFRAWLQSFQSHSTSI